MKGGEGGGGSASATFRWSRTFESCQSCTESVKEGCFCVLLVYNKSHLFRHSREEKDTG